MKKALSFVLALVMLASMFVIAPVVSADEAAAEPGWLMLSDGKESDGTWYANGNGGGYGTVVFGVEEDGRDYALLDLKNDPETETIQNGVFQSTIRMTDSTLAVVDINKYVQMEFVYKASEALTPPAGHMHLDVVSADTEYGRYFNNMGWDMATDWSRYTFKIGQAPAAATPDSDSVDLSAITGFCIAHMNYSGTPHPVDIYIDNVVFMTPECLEARAAKEAEVEALAAALTAESSADQIKAAAAAYAEGDAAYPNFTIASYDNLKTIAGVQLIDAQLGALTDITLDSEGAIVAARLAYNKLTDDQKAQITNLAVLEAAEVDLVELKIAAIGDEITTSKKSVIEAAREAVNALSETQQAAIENLDVLVAAETELNDIVAARAVDSQIRKLPDPDDIDGTDEEGAAIAEVRAAYDALTDNGKSKVSKYDELVAVEAAYAEATAYTLGELDGKEGITAADALIALQAAVKKITLDETQTKAADVNNDGSVTAADALLVLQRAVGKIDKFPIEEAAE